MNAAGDANRSAAPLVQIRNLQRKIRIDLTSLERFAPRALAVCRRKYGRKVGGKLPAEIFVLLISDRRIANLHRRFLHQSGSTDVITFQHGEIFISVPTARRQARRFGTSLTREIQLYIVHAFLHLVGWDDATPRQRQQMRGAEASVMRHAIGLK